MEVPRPKKPKQLPKVLSVEEILRLFEVTSNLKHRLIVQMIYSAGLRLSEVVNIRIRDIQFDLQVIFIKAGKGKKDRYVALAHRLFPLLKAYNLQYRPVYWLFEGQSGGQYSKRSVQQILRKAVEKSMVNPYATVHTLRHSYATHCVENGYSLALIQEALGHGSLKTTERYLHVSSETIRQLRSPLDLLMDRAEKGGKEDKDSRL